MNVVVLDGRLTRDPDIYRSGESVTAKITIASNRNFANKDGNYDASFISCVAFGKTAEFIERYFRKGMKIITRGRIQTGSYTNKDGNKVYTTDVVIADVEFGESKGATSQQTAPQTAPQAPAPQQAPPQMPTQQAPQYQAQAHTPAPVPAQPQYQQYQQAPPVQQAPQVYPQQNNGWLNVQPGTEEELPFN